MKYTLEIAIPKHSGTFIYQMRKELERSLWHTTIESATTRCYNSTEDAENHTIIQTIDFDSLDQLRSDYPELFI